jgi:hypothetical protein
MRDATAAFGYDEVAADIPRADDGFFHFGSSGCVDGQCGDQGGQPEDATGTDVHGGERGREGKRQEERKGSATLEGQLVPIKTADERFSDASEIQVFPVARHPQRETIAIDRVRPGKRRVEER